MTGGTQQDTPAIIQGHRKGLLTCAVLLRVLPEAVLHGLELLHAVDTLWLFLREYEARECLAELHAARPVCHPTEAWAVPVDLACDGVVRSAAALFLLALCGSGYRICCWLDSRLFELSLSCGRFCMCVGEDIRGRELAC